jgi:PKD repeat protein
MREELAAPVGATLYFAGEATHNGAPATVPGALQSGERAAGEHDTAAGGPPDPGAPTANFDANPTSGNVPFIVSFADLSETPPPNFLTGWSWDFGDGGASGDKNPLHQYTTAGEYTVSLTATNIDGSHTRVFPNLILVPEPSGSLGLGAGIVGLLLLHARRRRPRVRSGRYLHE